MKTKRKFGFTLVELLVTITLLSIISGIVIVVITNANKNAKDKGIQISEANVITAGSGYVNEYQKEIEWSISGTEYLACITVEELIETGYLKKETVGSNYEEYSIKVIKKDTQVNEYTLVKSTDCQNIDKTAPVATLSQSPETSSTSWVNNSVILTGTSTDKGSGIIAYQFSKSQTPSNSSWKEYSTKKRSITETHTVSEKGNWYFHVKDKNGNIGSNSIQVYTDNIAPVFQNSTGNFLVSNDGLLVHPTANFTDADSGIKEIKYYVTTSTTVPENTNSSFVKKLSTTATLGSKYYAYAIAIDNAENISNVASLGEFVYAPPTNYKPVYTGNPCLTSPAAIQQCMLNNSAMWHQADNEIAQDYFHYQNEQLAEYANKFFGQDYEYENTGHWYNGGTVVNP